VLAQIVLAAGSLVAVTVGAQTVSMVSMTLLATMLAMYMLAAIAAAISSGKKHGWSVTPFLPLLFPIYHYAYGIGFVSGIVYWMMGGSQRFRPTFFYGLSR
jgi:hypothetical protein